MTDFKYIKEVASVVRKQTFYVESNLTSPLDIVPLTVDNSIFKVPKIKSVPESYIPLKSFLLSFLSINSIASLEEPVGICKSTS